MDWTAVAVMLGFVGGVCCAVIVGPAKKPHESLSAIRFVLYLALVLAVLFVVGAAAFAFQWFLYATLAFMAGICVTGGYLSATSTQHP